MRRTVPVSEGSHAAVTLETPLFRVTRARFAAGGYIAPHVHDRSCVAVMLRGAFDLRFSGRPALECPAGSLVIEPHDAEHCNCISHGGADVLVLQPDVRFAADDRPLSRLLSDVHHIRSREVDRVARRMAAECRHPDALSPVMLEGLAVELLVAAARSEAGRGARGSDRVAPAWLRSAEEIIHARFRERIGLAEVADACGVHPSRLARAFRQQHGTSVSAFVRALRVEWVAGRLRTSDASLAQLALDVGFTDQSHLTHRFAQVMGMTPGRWRREAASAGSVRRAGDRFSARSRIPPHPPPPEQ